MFLKGVVFRMVIAAHQPNYIPYLGFFYKIYKCDRFVFVDDVQFSNQNGITHHRNVIKTPNGAELISVPIKKNIDYKINQVEINYSNNWEKKNLKTLFVNYKKAPYFNEVYNWYEEIISCEYERLVDFNIELIRSICNKMGIDREFYVNSDYSTSGAKQDLVLDIMREYKGQVYYSGTGAAAYLCESKFQEFGLDLVFSDYHPVQYIQQWRNFIPNLSIIDYLFNCGFNNPFIETKSNMYNIVKGQA